MNTPMPPSQHAPVPQRQTSPMAVVSLVSGILSWILLPLLGSVVAIITGHMARAEIRREPQRLEGDGLAVGGLVLGYLQLLLLLLGLIVIFLFFGGMALLASQQGSP